MLRLVQNKINTWEPSTPPLDHAINIPVSQPDFPNHFQPQPAFPIWTSLSPMWTISWIIYSSFKRSCILLPLHFPPGLPSPRMPPWHPMTKINPSHSKLHSFHEACLHHISMNRHLRSLTACGKLVFLLTVCCFLMLLLVSTLTSLNIFPVPILMFGALFCLSTSELAHGALHTQQPLVKNVMLKFDPRTCKLLWSKEIFLMYEAMELQKSMPSNIFG